MRTLLIGYGNSLRSDDGAGPEVARRVAELGLSDLEVIEVHQLLPEHAERISHFERVVFVDASTEEDLDKVSMTKVKASAGVPGDPHASDPAALLGWSERLFDGQAEAWLIRLPGVDLGLGEGFSETMAEAIPVAVRLIRGLCESRSRLRCVIRGMVQGVGFRPHVHHLAEELGLAGWVCNTGEGVVLEVEGGEAVLRQFLVRIEPEKPAHSVITGMESSWLEPMGFLGFEIRPSPAGGPRTAMVLPDIATCDACLDDITDSSNRRFAYPFTNCTHCGPRFSIIEGLPYDRAGTSMKGFEMCEACRTEYEDPHDRRFHAQPNACPKCGPRLEWLSSSGESLAIRGEALDFALTALRDGLVVAVKGLGGFHLMARADDEAAVERLRERKRRWAKPFALMMTSLKAVGEVCHCSEMEARLLVSPEAPIVLLDRLEKTPGIAEAVAPGAPQLGVMLPSNPLHHLLMRGLSFPVVATSGNLSDEPICTDNDEALRRLSGIADGFLVHDRPIIRHVDDSIVRVLMGREMVLRRARGYAPMPVPIEGLERPVLAVGAHLKSTVAVADRGRIFVSQHLGDLETEAASDAHQRAIRDLQRLFDIAPSVVAADLHPDYISTRLAEDSGLPLVRVQHHYAHALACLADNCLTGPALAVVWDGTGYGGDETIWGGEFLEVTDDGFERVAHLRKFPLPGGDAAAREPRRSLTGMLHEIGAIELLEDRFSATDLKVVIRMLERGINTVATSSAGRLIDGFASLLGIRQSVGFEAQAAVELEFAAAGNQGEAIPMAIIGDERPWQVDWMRCLIEIAERRVQGESTGRLAADFHQSLVSALVEVARRAGHEKVLLTGGCFQNRLLLQGAVGALKVAGFKPFWHQRVPPNDGGISCGQVVAARRSKGG
ncbi:carbamoyltransferase HypF [Haloferula sp.]|uniref:carbamoyltransferase HypF n=1 Tax=Haloferula sp. TaxID=2497595 RepID=UPI003C72DB82